MIDILEEIEFEPEYSPEEDQYDEVYVMQNGHLVKLEVADDA